MTMSTSTAEEGEEEVKVKMISLEEATNILQKEAIDKLIHNLELGVRDKLFTTEEYMRFYTVVYDAAAGGAEAVYSLYGLYRKIFEDYNSSKVLPCLRCYSDERLLKEFVWRWSNHKIMTMWLSRFFQFLPGRAFSSKQPSFLQISHLEFYDRTGLEIMDQLSIAMSSLVDREREGEENIDLSIVKQVMDIFDEICVVALNKPKLIQTINAFRSPVPVQRQLPDGRRRVICDDSKTHLGFASSRVNELLHAENVRVSRFLSLSLTHKDKILQVYGEIEGRIHHVMAPHLVPMKRLSEDFDVGGVLNHVWAIIDESSRLYAKDIEEKLVEATASFYSNKALHWMATKSYEDYMLKVEECLQKEETRVSDYLSSTKKRELIEVVQHELVDVHADKLEEKECSRIKWSR